MTVRGYRLAGPKREIDRPGMLEIQSHGNHTDTALFVNLPIDVYASIIV